MEILDEYCPSTPETFADEDYSAISPFCDLR